VRSRDGSRALTCNGLPGTIGSNFSRYGFFVFATALVAWASVVSSFAQTSVAPRSQAAVTLIQQSITAMGGTSAWTPVTAVHTEWTTVGTQGSEYQGKAQWDDDWSGGFLVFRHVTTDTQGTHVLAADQNHEVSDVEPGATTALPQRLQELTQPLHVPAAVFLSELANTQYQVSYAGTTGNLATVVLVKVVAPGIIDEFTRQTWTIDTGSNLPVSVIYYTLGLYSHRPLRQVLAFSSYQKYGALLLPSLLVYDPTGQPFASQLTAFTMN
jgi:hypothetical protein